MSPVLLNQEHPYLRIQLEDGSYIRFEGGKLEIEEDDSRYEQVMAEAERNPFIVVYKSIATCGFCGVQFPSKTKREEHVKETHFDRWLEREDAEAAEIRNVEIKSREGFACDVCRPAQVFPDELALGEHVKAFHTAAPNLDDDGNERGAPATVSSEIPAATRTEG